jgi:acetylornithine aminotransferase
VRTENFYLYDKEGKKYVDFESGIWCTPLGHCHSRINSVMEAQIKKVVHLGTHYHHFLAQETAKDILDKVLEMDILSVRSP